MQTQASRNDIGLQWDGKEDVAQLLEREWIVTNGLGGYSSSSLAGANSRKYHGLFVPNLSSPKGRHVLISRCDELVVAGERRYDLGTVEFADGKVSGEGHRWLRQFHIDRTIACWLYDIQGIRLEKAIVMVHQQNTVCVRYRLLSGASSVELRIRPFVSFRRQDEAPDAPRDGKYTLTVQEGRHEVSLTGTPITLRMAMQPKPSIFTTDARHDLETVYRIDRERGESSLENVFSPGWFTATITASEPACFVASAHSWEWLEFDAFGMFDAERRRLDDLVSRANLPVDDEVVRRLTHAADQFIVLPGSRMEESVLAQAQGTELRSVYAGYHWFADWGRDTMISLEGLTLCTGRVREAGAILKTFANYVRDGLLPNLFPEGERQALYHTVDATMWYFHAISRYVAVSGNYALVKDLYPILESIIDHHLRGTHFGIHVDKDGLISAAAEGYQLTWMDAKVNGWVVTPRRGKPVEIQALWYNALSLMRSWSERLGKSPERYDKLAAQVRTTFNSRYWNETAGCLFDVIDGPDGDDDAIRPNQVFAMSLAHAVLDESRWKPMIDVVKEKLVTPFGLRTLSADHRDYKAHYRGDLLARDAAYHQGTVWPWLIGHFIDAWLKVYPDKAVARRFLEGFPEHLRDAGVGSISEIFDAEAPHRPGGCMAQAWSVAEVLRAWLITAPSARPH
jgi:predicted glycogen debranching enzyme